MMELGFKPAPFWIQNLKPYPVYYPDFLLPDMALCPICFVYYISLKANHFSHHHRSNNECCGPSKRSLEQSPNWSTSTHFGPRSNLFSTLYIVRGKISKHKSSHVAAPTKNTFMASCKDSCLQASF